MGLTLPQNFGPSKTGKHGMIEPKQESCHEAIPVQPGWRKIGAGLFYRLLTRARKNFYIIPKSSHKNTSGEQRAPKKEKEISMIAWFMISGFLPVVPGVIAMMTIGFLVGLFGQPFIVSLFSLINDVMWLPVYLLNEFFPETLGYWLGSVVHAIQLPERESNTLVVVFALLYMAIEILIFAFVLIRRARAGERIPDIKQRFEIKEDR